MAMELVDRLLGRAAVGGVLSELRTDSIDLQTLRLAEQAHPTFVRQDSINVHRLRQAKRVSMDSTQMREAAEAALARAPLATGGSMPGRLGEHDAHAMRAVAASAPAPASKGGPVAAALAPLAAAFASATGSTGDATPPLSRGLTSLSRRRRSSCESSVHPADIVPVVASPAASSEKLRRGGSSRSALNGDTRPDTAPAAGGASSPSPGASASDGVASIFRTLLTRLTASVGHGSHFNQPSNAAASANATATSPTGPSTRHSRSGRHSSSGRPSASGRHSAKSDPGEKHERPEPLHRYVPPPPGTTLRPALRPATAPRRGAEPGSPWHSSGGSGGGGGSRRRNLEEPRGVLPGESLGATGSVGTGERGSVNASLPGGVNSADLPGRLRRSLSLDVETPHGGLDQSNVTGSSGGGLQQQQQH